MISIRVSDEGLRRCGRLVNKLVVNCALQISKDMLCSLPVSQTRIGVESGKNSGSIRNIWPCGDGQIHQRAHKQDVGVLLHV